MAEGQMTLAQWLANIREHQDRIFVRDKRPDGSWGPVALSAVSPVRYGEIVAQWLEDGHTPVRVLTDEERAERAASA